MRIFNELRYPSSNLSEIFTQRMFQASFEKIWKIFFELSRGQAWSYGRTDRQTDRQTDGQTDRQTDRRTDAGNDNTPPALGPRGKNGLTTAYFYNVMYMEHVESVFFCFYLETGTRCVWLFSPAQSLQSEWHHKSVMASQIIGASTLCSKVCSGKQQWKRKIGSVLSLFVGNPSDYWPFPWGNHRWISHHWYD